MIDYIIPGFVISAIILWLINWVAEYNVKRGRYRRDVEKYMKEVYKIAKDRGYIVPSGFLNEPYKTALHAAMRNLKSAGFIRCDGKADSRGNHERWVA